jgi:RecA-family ATPase
MYNNDTDRESEYIGEYIYYCFQEMRNPFIPRDKETEQKIIQASMAESYLFAQEIQGRTTGCLRGDDRRELNEPLFFKPSELPFQIITPRLRHYAKKNKLTIIESIQKIQSEINGFDPSSIFQPIINSEIKNLQKKINELKVPEDLQHYSSYCIEYLQRRIDALQNSEVATVNNFYHWKYYGQGFSTACLFEKDGCVKSVIRINYFSSKKILLPSFASSIDYGRFYYFSPYFPKQPLFNLYYLKQRPSAIVILTDSVELAKKNQIFLNREGITDIIWVSWFDPNEILDNIDWSPLKGRKLYFLLKEHSGMGTEQVYKTAEELKAKLPTPAYRPLRYICLLPYIESKPEPSYLIARSPMMWNSIDFIKKTSNKSNAYREFLKHRISEKGAPRLIFKPFIYERTVSMLYGPPNAGKTWIAVSIAAALKHGQKVWDGWEATDVFNVLYIHGAMDERCFQEKLEKVEKQYKGTESRGIIEFVTLVTDSLPLMEDARTIVSCVDSFMRRYNCHPNLVILDSLPFIRKLKKVSGEKIELQQKIQDIKYADCAIMIVCDAHKHTELNIIKKDWSVEAVVKINSNDSICPEKIAASAHLLKGTRNKDSQTYQKIEFEPEADIPRWEIITTERSKEENKFLINDILRKKNKISDSNIARHLNLTVDQIKKLKSEIRKDYEPLVLDAFNKKNMMQYQIAIKYNLAGQFVNTIIKKQNSSKRS